MRLTKWFLVFTFAMLFLSCATRKRVEYVDREVIKYETKVQHDTVIRNVKDSIYHTIFQKGDTVYNTKYIERIKYLDKKVYVHDTTYRDSIRIEYKEITKVKKVIPKWCYFSLLITIILCIFATNKAAKWLK